MANWDAAIHPDDRPAYDAFIARARRRARAPTSSTACAAPTASPAGCTIARRPPAARRTVEISGIVSDVTERRRMRAELAEAHAALSQVVEAMDAHLYTLASTPTAATATSTGARTARR